MWEFFPDRHFLMLIYQEIIVMPKSLRDAKQSRMPLALTKKQEYNVGIFRNMGRGSPISTLFFKKCSQKIEP